MLGKIVKLLLKVVLLLSGMEIFESFIRINENRGDVLISKRGD